MIEIIDIFKWTILAGMVAALALSQAGMQIAARDKSMQTLCIGQGAMLGVLIGIGISTVTHATTNEFNVHFLPFILSVLVSAMIGLFGMYIESKNFSSKNTYFIGLFSVILALNYLVSAIFPGLESHMAQVFFGDLATLKQSDVYITLFFSLVVVSLSFVTWKQSSDRSFEIAIFGAKQMKSHRLLNTNNLIDLTSFLFVCFSIQFLGFLFTIACLFLPTVVHSLFVRRNIRKHILLMRLTSAIGSVAGFVFSLFLGTLPTVPTIVIAIVLTGLTFGVTNQVIEMS